MTSPRWTLVLLAACACGQRPPRLSIAPVVTPVAQPAAAPDASAPAPGCSAAPVDENKCLDYAASMALGQSLAQSHDLECASKVLDAVVDDRPGDARALFQRAHVRFLAGSNELEDLEMALGLIPTEKWDRDLAAAIWLDKGALYRRKGQGEQSRMAFSIAEHLGAKAATAELGNASRCAATWESRPQGRSPIAKSWHELAVARFQWGKCDQEEPPKSEAASKKYACRSCLDQPSSAHIGPLADSCPKTLDQWSLYDCEGFGGPWDTFDVEPLAGGRFYYEPHFEEGPAGERPILGHRLQQGQLVLETTDGTTVKVPGSEAFAERAANEMWNIPEESPTLCASGRDLRFMPGGGACPNNAVGPGWGAGAVAFVTPFAPRRIDYYDLSTGRGRFQIVVWDAEPRGVPRTDDIHVVIGGSTATVTGAGCSAVVPLKP